MPTVTKYLKLPFLKLNRSKADEFARLQVINTRLANQFLAVPRSERRSITTAHFRDVELGSSWVARTVRNVNKTKKAKKFKCMPLEIGPGGWTLYKFGETFSVAFCLTRGIKKRVPLEVHSANHKQWLGSIMRGKAEPKSLKIVCSRNGTWSIVIAVSKEVPDASKPGLWLGVDLGMKIPAVAALPEKGRGFFFKSGRLKHIRRRDDRRREKLKKLGKHRAIRKMVLRSKREVTHINHVISKQLVSIASRHGIGIRFEYLRQIHLTLRQSRRMRTDSWINLNFWTYGQLQEFGSYKAALAKVPVEFVPARLTSKTHYDCGHLGSRYGFTFRCRHCKKTEHADLNASRNVGAYVGLFCAIDPGKGAAVMASSDLSSGLFGGALNPVREADPTGSV